MVASNKILQLGNPLLYRVSESVKREEIETIKPHIQQLHEALMQFRDKYKRGRAIAAPQIGVFKRIIYMNIDNQPTVFINPEFTWKSPEMFELWDDCMSFPDLLVKVTRHTSCKLQFFDMNWEKNELELSGDLSELLQHEYDHLDGILATMRAVDGKSFALCSQKKYIDFAR
jgi:peptide deformylase